MPSLPSALDKSLRRRGVISPRDAVGRSPTPCLRLRGDQLRPTLREIYRSRYKRSVPRAISSRVSSRWKSGAPPPDSRNGNRRSPPFCKLSADETWDLVFVLMLDTT